MRKVYLVLTGLLLVSVVIQFYFAAFGVFDALRRRPGAAVSAALAVLGPVAWLLHGGEKDVSCFVGGGHDNSSRCCALTFHATAAVGSSHRVGDFSGGVSSPNSQRSQARANVQCR